MIFPSFSSRRLSRIFVGLGALALGAGALNLPVRAQNAPTALPFSGAALTQDFNSLSATTPSPNTNTTLPPGFGFVEAGGDTTYVAGTGAENSGNTYSYGAAGSSERALGSLLSGSVTPTIGVFIRNDSGQTLTQFTVAYRGEQYRLGAARTDGIPDRLNFQYSTTATALNAATGFSDVDALDFASLVSSGTAGPVMASTPISATVTGVSVAPGATLVLRWSDFNVSGADDGLAIDDFSFSIAGGATATPTPTATATATPTATPIPTPTPPPTGPTSGALISEYRWSGPNGALDEFVELVNISGAPLNVSNWSVRGGNVIATIPPGTAAIPARGHLLLTGSAYSLGDLGGVGQAAGDVGYAGNFPDGAPLSLRNGAGDEVDGVSGAVLPAPPLGSQSSFVRRQENNTPRDTGDDLSDFNVVEVSSTSNGSPTNTGISSGLLRLGAPGPQNRNSPIVSGVLFGLLNPAQGAYTGDNGFRNGAANSGTYTVRRTLLNNTGATITRLRFRAAAFTTGTPVGPDAASIADTRILDGGAVFQINGIDVMPIRVENLPGAGVAGDEGVLNSSASIALPSGGLAPDATVAFEIVMRVAKSGNFRLTYLFEAASDAPAPPRSDNDNLLLGNPSLAATLTTEASKENLLVEHPALSLGYQKSAGEPKWVSWHLDQSDIGSSGRSGSFPSDPSLPADCRITEGDYNSSGYTRGHQCPSGDRTSSDAINQQVFYMSNMVPQTAALNNGVWNNFEVYCRSLLGNGANELYIMSGGVGSLGRIAGGKVNVPASCWKVVVILPKGGGDLSRISANTRVLSILVPNTASVSSSYANYYTTVDNIENQTGLDLLANISDSIENTLEARQSN